MPRKKKEQTESEGKHLVLGDIIYMDPNELIPYENNPRAHGDELDFLCNLMQRFGFPPSKAIEVDKDMVIINGHGRRLAALRLGMTRVPVFVRSDLSEEECRAERVADNKVSDLSGWDFDSLGIEMAELKELGWDMEDFGFADMTFFEDTEAEDTSEDTVTVADPQPPEEEAETVEEPIKVPETDIKRGDVFMLGKHRLMCGDSTSRDDIDTLMNGTRADITFTSPPYNAGHLGTGRARDGKKYINDEDSRSDEEYFKFLTSNMDILLDVSHEVFYNMGLVSGSKRTIIKLLDRYSDRFKDIVYWEKSNPVPAIAKNIISSSVEWIMAFGENNSRSFRCDPGIYYGVIKGPVAGNNRYKDIHRATFPLYLPVEVVQTFTEEGDTVLDCFGGTGTTMIACEQTGRTCYMMELEPVYCQVIIDRWEEETGQKAIKV